MELVQAIIVGIVQGVFEWLPVSSEAVITLILTQFMNADPAQALNASIFLHTGTMFAAFIYFRDEYLEILKHIIERLDQPRQILKGEEGRLTAFLIISTFITGVIGAGIYFTGLKSLVENPAVFYVLMSAALFVTGVLRLYRKSESRSYSSVDIRDSIFVGFLQGFSIIPGISRSGTTAFGFLYRDFDARSAFHLSFLMSVPAVAAGSIGLELFTEFAFHPMYLVASAVAGIIGYITIDTVLEVADRAEIAWICFGLAILALAPVFL
jgi:undecaprenyl-diphosphatase